MIQVLQFFLSLSILVVLHEFGHYITARFFGCRVEKFYLFMDWPVALFKKKIGDTEFGVGCAPLGGYVKISGFIDESMDDTGIESEPEPWELRAKPAWQRLIVMLGGIVVNIILAWVIYSMLAFSWGEKQIPISSFKDGFSFSEEGLLLGFKNGDILVSMDGEKLVNYDPGTIVSSILFEGVEEVVVIRNGYNTAIGIDSDLVNQAIKNLSQESGPLLSPNTPFLVGSFSEQSVAKKNGLQLGDRIIAINSVETPYFNKKTRELLMSFVGEKVTLTVERFDTNKELRNFNISFIMPESGLMGVNVILDEYAETTYYSFFESFGVGLAKTKKTIKMYWSQVKTIFNPSTGAYKHVGGFISIGSMFPSSWSWYAFWSMTALLSVILAIMNLLPIPALDGGHALIAFGEMVTGKKVPIKVLMPLQVVGMVVLLALVLFANGMDIVRLFN